MNSRARSDALIGGVAGGGVLVDSFGGAFSESGEAGLRLVPRVFLPVESKRGHSSTVGRCSPVLGILLGRVAELGAVGGEVK